MTQTVQHMNKMMTSILGLFLLFRTEEAQSSKEKKILAGKVLEELHFDLSALLNSCGENLIWDLRSKELVCASSCESLAPELHCILSENELYEQSKHLKFQEKKEVNISKKNVDKSGDESIKKGSYTCSFCASGDLILPDSSTISVIKLRIVERYFTKIQQAPFEVTEYHKVYNVFFKPGCKKAILTYSEILVNNKSKALPEFYSLLEISN
ncbi:MAG TPA: hypothetical protein PK809_09400 [Bacteroidia bacterium]|nr:hypothetical protein [Bacteroidia bacterium]